MPGLVVGWRSGAARRWVPMLPAAVIGLVTTVVVLPAGLLPAAFRAPQVHVALETANVLVGLLVALLFPLGYGIYDFAQRRRVNFISAIGFVSVLITGGFGLMKLDGFWFAVKDGAMPALVGIAVLASLRAKEPLVHEILYNPQVIDVERVDRALTERNAHAGFAQLMRKSSYLIASAMLISAVFATAKTVRNGKIWAVGKSGRPWRTTARRTPSSQWPWGRTRWASCSLRHPGRWHPPRCGTSSAASRPRS